MPLNWLLVAGLMVAVDQLSKRFVLDRRGGGLGSRPISCPVVRPISNTRMGFGLVGKRRDLFLLWIAAAVGIALLIDRFVFLQVPIAQVGLGTALGGATGNLVDMLWRGEVIDFIDLRVWPVFNFADMAIILGIAAALWPALVCY